MMSVNRGRVPTVNRNGKVAGADADRKIKKITRTACAVSAS